MNSAQRSQFIDCLAKTLIASLAENQRSNGRKTLQAIRIVSEPTDAQLPTTNHAYRKATADQNSSDAPQTPVHPSK